MTSSTHAVRMTSALAICMTVAAASVVIGRSGAVEAGEPPAGGGNPFNPHQPPEAVGTVDDDNDTLGTWVQVVDSQGNISYVPEGGGGGGGGGQSAVYWRVVRIEINVVDDVANFPDCDPGPESGRWVRYELVDRASGAVLRQQNRCLLAGEDPAAGIPDLEPPSVEEILAATDIPSPGIVVNPDTEGITGMETWLWADVDDTTVESDVELRGWSVHATLEATEWRWSVESETYTSGGPGSAEEPAATHVFDTKGTHEIVVEVTWTGGYVVEGYGITYEVPGLAATTTGALDYVVVEVVSVVDDADADD